MPQKATKKTTTKKGGSKKVSNKTTTKKGGSTKNKNTKLKGG